VSQQLGALETHTIDTFLFISHTMNLLLFKFRCNIFNAGFGSEWDTLYLLSIYLLPPGDNPIAVNKCIISYHILSENQIGD